MKFEEHCQRCKEVLGKPFEHVHKWLDEFHGDPRYGTKHRKFRHHWEGIEFVRSKWGEESASAAKLHVLDDIKTGECGEADDIYIPKDSEDYKKRGYW